MHFIVNKNDKDYKVTVNEDLTASIDNIPSKFDPLYNAVIVNEGYLIDDQYVKGLRIEPKYVKKILKLNEEYMKSYDKYIIEQKAYVPKTVRLENDIFTYTNPFNPIVTQSEVVEKLNLLIEGDKKLIEKIKEKFPTENINVKDLIKMEEYKDYIKSLKKYEKLRQQHAEKEEKFNDLIKDKQKVGMNECTNCNEFFIVGNEKAKFLSKVIFFEARNDWLDLDNEKNEYSEFCLGVTDKFVFIKIGNADSCTMCKI